MVCEDLHQKRTIPLYNTVIKKIKEDQDNFYLLGGFKAVDEIPVIKVSEQDDYYSCVEKIESVFRRKWDDADWHMICDDDTFIHTANLKKFISTLSQDNLRIYSGKSGAKKNFIFGGAGILLNRKTFLALREYVKIRGWKYDRMLMNHSDIALFHICSCFNRRFRNDVSKKIYLVFPETMVNINKTHFTKIGVSLPSNILSIHVKGYKSMRDELGLNICHCPYKFFKDYFYNENFI